MEGLFAELLPVLPEGLLGAGLEGAGLEGLEGAGAGLEVEGLFTAPLLEGLEGLLFSAGLSFFLPLSLLSALSAGFSAGLLDSLESSCLSALSAFLSDSLESFLSTETVVSFFFVVSFDVSADVFTSCK